MTGGLRGHAAQALVNLACHEGNRAALVQEGVVRPLITLCRGPRENVTMLANAAAALANLARHEANRSRIVAEEAVAPLAELLEWGGARAGTSFTTRISRHLPIP